MGTTLQSPKTNTEGATQKWVMGILTATILLLSGNYWGGGDSEVLEG